jgi:hypothetical protein
MATIDVRILCLKISCVVLCVSFFLDFRFFETSFLQNNKRARISKKKKKNTHTHPFRKQTTEK